MFRKSFAIALTLVLVPWMGGAALAWHPANDPSVGYNAEALDAAAQAARAKTAPKTAREAERAFAPTVGDQGRPGKATEPSFRAWDPNDPRTVNSGPN